MKSYEKRCTQCGWWDMAMKYGQLDRCTQCGAPLKPPLKFVRPEPAIDHAKIA